MALKIYWTPSAIRNFDSIIDYLEKEWGETVAVAFSRKVFEFLDILAEFPEIGTIEHPEMDIRGFVIVKQVSVFYRIKGERIILLNFFDNRRDPDNR